MTWSIVAVDATTGEAGIAVASCVPLEVVLRVPGFAPGRGAIATQSFLLDGERERGVELLASGLGADDVLARLLDPAFDPDFAQRQIAVVDIDGEVAPFTGDAALPFAGHATARFGAIAIAVQGNILTGQEVIDEARTAVVGAAPCDLPARLLAALEAGGGGGRGDSRCTPLGRSAQAATLRAGAFAIDVGVETAGEGTDPLVALRARFDALRSDHPCPATGDDGDGDGDGGDGGAGGPGGLVDAGHSSSGSGEPPHVASGAADGDGCSLRPPLSGGSSWWLVGLAIASTIVLSRRCRCWWDRLRSRR